MAITQERRVYLKKYHVRRKEADPNYYFRRTLQRYGLTQDDFDRLVERQGGVCAICKEPCPTNQRLSVDHDHETGEVRGLLCRRCNAGIGHFQERLDLLREAVRYLEVR